MKVICIDAGPGTLINPSGFKLVEGGEYIIAFEFIGLLTGKYCYALIEDPYKGGYKKDRFIPLSDISETEFERNYNKELV